MGKMNRDALKIVGPERAALASLLPVGAEHKVVYNQLALVSKKIFQVLFAVRPLEPVFLFNLDPGKLPDFLGEFIPEFRKLLFFF